MQAQYSCLILNAGHAMKKLDPDHLFLLVFFFQPFYLGLLTQWVIGYLFAVPETVGYKPRDGEDQKVAKTHCDFAISSRPGI